MAAGGKKSIGLELTRLRWILKKKLPTITDEQLRLVMEKMNHKARDSINWKEFLLFLSSEGMRRETVNDAQLYGFGVKRLEEHERIKLND